MVVVSPQERKFSGAAAAYGAVTGRGFELYSVDDVRGEVVLKTKPLIHRAESTARRGRSRTWCLADVCHGRITPE